MRRAGCVNSGAIHGRRPDRRRAATSRPHLHSTRTRNSFASGGRMARVLERSYSRSQWQPAAFALAGCGPTPARTLTGASMSPDPRISRSDAWRPPTLHAVPATSPPCQDGVRPGGRPRG